MSYKALVVDDETNWQDIFSGNLSRAGYEVKIASSLPEARDLLFREFFHIAVVDYRLDRWDKNNTDGLTVLEKIREFDEGTESILCTGYGEFRTARDAIKRYGAFDALTKQALEPQDLTSKANAAATAAADSYREKFGSETYLVDLLRGGEPRHIWSTNLLRVLGVRGGAGEMDKFLRELFQELAPLKPDPSQPQAEVNIQTSIATARFWSKFLGQPILVKFSRREITEAEADSYNAEFARINQYSKRYRYLTSTHWGGLVYTLAGWQFEDFYPQMTPHLLNHPRDREERNRVVEHVQEVREKLTKLEAEITALSRTLAELEEKGRRAHYPPEQYFRLRFGMIADSEESIAKLQNLLQELGAADASSVLDKVKEGRDEAEIRDELEKVAQSAEEKGWGKHLLDQVREYKGDIAVLAIRLAIEIAKAAGGIP